MTIRGDFRGQKADEPGGAKETTLDVFFLARAGAARAAIRAARLSYRGRDANETMTHILS